MEKTYGKGLIGLFNEEGVPTHKALRAGNPNRMRPGYNSLQIYGLGTIDAETTKAWFIGFANGIQYKGMTSGFEATIADVA
jgi:hypothetical protein